MERAPDDLYGMKTDDAKEYLAAHLASKRLNEKKLAELEAAIAKWAERAALARGKDMAELAAAAEAEAAKSAAERDKLASETAELAGQIDRMRRQVPGLAARERSVDPDLLEQELAIAAGRTPGDESASAAAKASRELADLEKRTSADEQLAALKARMAPGESGTKR